MGIWGPSTELVFSWPVQGCPQCLDGGSCVLRLSGKACVLVSVAGPGPAGPTGPVRLGGQRVPHPNQCFSFFLFFPPTFHFPFPLPFAKSVLGVEVGAARSLKPWKRNPVV